MDIPSDPGSVRRAFDEWRKACVSNRMQCSLLTHRLHSVKQKLRDLLQGKHWNAPLEPTSEGGPLRKTSSSKLKVRTIYYEQTKIKIYV